MKNNGYLAANRTKIGPRFLGRAENIYNLGKVTLVSFDGKTVKAKVEGTKIYAVQISFNDLKQITSASCSCPYNEVYNVVCKHQIAVLLALDQADLSRLLIAKDKPSKPSFPALQKGRYADFIKRYEDNLEEGGEGYVTKTIDLLREAKSELRPTDGLLLTENIALKALKAHDSCDSLSLLYPILNACYLSSPNSQRGVFLHDFHRQITADHLETFYRWFLNNEYTEDYANLMEELFLPTDIMAFEKTKNDNVYRLLDDASISKALTHQRTLVNQTPFLLSYAISKQSFTILSTIAEHLNFFIAKTSKKLLLDSLKDLPPHFGFLNALVSSFRSEPTPKEALSYFRKFTIEERKDLIRSNYFVRYSQDADAFLMIAQEYTPKKQSDFNHLSPRTLIACQEEIRNIDVPNVGALLAKSIERIIRNATKAKYIEGKDILELLDIISSYMEFGEVVQLLKSPSLDETTFRLGPPIRNHYLTLIKDMPQFAGLRRF